LVFSKLEWSFENGSQKCAVKYSRSDVSKRAGPHESKAEEQSEGSQNASGQFSLFFLDRELSALPTHRAAKV